jgi:enamine deaminase RidA (YjgF/YER057c/UK114 family)
MSADITLNSSAGSFRQQVITRTVQRLAVSSSFLGNCRSLSTARKSGCLFEDQTRLVLQNIDACLAGAGVSRQHLVSVRVYVTDMNQWPTFNKIYGEWIGDFRPSRAVAGVAELHYGFALEVEAMALAPQA